MKPDIIDHKTICKQPGRYIGWPTICRRPDGELLVVFSGDRDQHVDPFGKSMLVRSSDGGDTWSDAELVNDTPLDDRDTGICALPDGSVVMSWFTSHYRTENYLNMCAESERDRWRAKLATVTAADIATWAAPECGDHGRHELGRLTRRSNDGGRTWEPAVREPASAPHGPNVLSDGRLYYVGLGPLLLRESGGGYLVTCESHDGGRSWQDVTRINMYPPYPGDPDDGFAYLCEPHVVETSPGNLLMMARYEEIPRNSDRGFLWQAFSEDGGATWTEPQPTGILGKPPHLTMLSDGRVLVSFGYRQEPFGQRACLSEDGGKSWNADDPIILRDDAPTSDLGYPASVQLDDGTIVTVYYQQEHAGEKTCLMATRWKV